MEGELRGDRTGGARLICKHHQPSFDGVWLMVLGGGEEVEGGEGRGRGRWI